MLQLQYSEYEIDTLYTSVCVFITLSQEKNKELKNFVYLYIGVYMCTFVCVCQYVTNIQKCAYIDIPNESIVCRISCDKSKMGKGTR